MIEVSDGSILIRARGDKKEQKKLINLCNKHKIFFSITPDYGRLKSKFFLGYHYSFFYDKHLKTKKYPFSISCHNQAQFLKAQKIGFKKAFISPVFKTKSHPNKKPLGVIKLFRILSFANKKTKVILLGGMSERKFFSIKKLDFKKHISYYAKMIR